MSTSILTVTPNPALDVSYQVGVLVPGASHRVTPVARVAGGKGLNVAGVAAAMGVTVTIAGPLGGPLRHEVIADLDRRGLQHSFTPIAGTTRTAVNVYASDVGQSTVLNEIGPQISASEWARLIDHVCDLASTAHVAVMSGSLPPGIEPQSVADLLLAARPTSGWIVDLRGPELVAALAARPAIIKPNVAELTATIEILDAAADSAPDSPLPTVDRPTSPAEIVSMARRLQDAGAVLVCVSDGPRGVIAVPLVGPVLRAHSAPVDGNPTGAGDALAAGLAVGLAAGAPVHDLLRTAVAWASAAVLQPTAGVVDPRDVAKVLPTVTIEELT